MNNNEQKPITPGEFERVLCKMEANAEITIEDGRKLLDAHNADIANMLGRLECYRHANGSKAARIQKMKEQYEEDMRSQKQYFAALESELASMKTPSAELLELFSIVAGRPRLLEAVAARENALKAKIKEVERERDFAIAHDRQPYPTAEAYEKVCAANNAKYNVISSMKDDIRDLVRFLTAVDYWADSDWEIIARQLIAKHQEDKP